MATVKVIDIISRAQTLLQDTGVYWLVTELQDWLNDGYREVLLLRPDANAIVDEMVCAAGVRQLITDFDAEALTIIDVVRNTATSSKQRGVRQVDRKSFTDQNPDWYTTKSSVDIQFFMVDGALPKEFLVYPPALSTAEVEVVYAKIPTPHALSAVQLVASDTAETIKLDDAYANILLDYIIYRAHSKDTDKANIEVAALHKQAMNNALVGKKT